MTQALTTAPLARPDDMASQAVFRRLLMALSEPGRVVDLPALDLAGGHPALSVPLALAAPEVGLAVLTAGEEPTWAEALRLAVGPQPVDPERADVVLALRPPTPDEVRVLRRGRADAPELGAQLVIGCRSLEGAGEVVLALTGPGVPGSREVAVTGVPVEVFEALASVNRARPAGVDAVLVDDAGRVVGLPRSTRVTATRTVSTAGAAGQIDGGGQLWATQR